jgi:hypothetical protein
LTRVCVAGITGWTGSAVAGAIDGADVLRHDPNESPEPYVAGTLYAVRAVGSRVGLTRGLDALLA